MDMAMEDAIKVKDRRSKMSKSKIKKILQLHSYNKVECRRQTGRHLWKSLNICMSSVYPGRIQGGRTMDRRMNNEYSYLNKNKGRGSRISAPFPHLRVMMLIGADWWLVIGDIVMKILEFHRDGFFSPRVPPRPKCTRTQTPHPTQRQHPNFWEGCLRPNWGVAASIDGTQDGIYITRKQGVFGWNLWENSMPKGFAKK